MEITVKTVSEHRTVTGQDIMLGDPEQMLASLAPGACTTCFWSSSSTCTCGVVLVDATSTEAAR